ncbi:hypothetical protein LLG34_04365, partial [bacterium]|nr:hypothetical protein [bacterium]
NLSTMINHSASTLILCQDCLFTSSFSLYGRWYGLTSSAPDIFNFDDCVFNVTGTVGTGTFNFGNGAGAPSSFNSADGTTTANFNNNPVNIIEFISTIAARPMTARFIASPINYLTINGLYTTVYADAVSLIPAITNGVILTNGATLAQLVPLDKSGNILGAPLQLADLSALQNYVFIGQLNVGQWGYATDTGKMYVLQTIGDLSSTTHDWVPLESTITTSNIIWNASVYPNFSVFYSTYSLASITYNVVIELAGTGHIIDAQAYTNMKMLSFNYGQPNNGFNQKGITVANGVTFDNAPNLLNNVVMTVNTTSNYLLTNPLNMSTAGMYIGDGSQLLSGSASTKIFDFSNDLSPITFNLVNGTIYGTTGAHIVNITAGGTNTIVINNSGTQAGVTPDSFYSSSAINLHITSEPDVGITYLQTDFINLTNITTFNLDYVANGAKIHYTLGSDATYDMYYRNSGGLLSRIAPTNSAKKQGLSFITGTAPYWSPIEQLLTYQSLSASDRWYLFGTISFDQVSTNVDASITFTSITNSFNSTNNSQISFTVKAYASITPAVNRDYVYRILSGFNSASRVKWRVYIDETITIYRGALYIYGLLPANCFSIATYNPIPAITGNSAYWAAASYSGTGTDPTGTTGLTLGYDSAVDDLGYSIQKSAAATAGFWTSSPNAIFNYSINGNTVTVGFKTLQVIADVNTSSIITFAAGTIPTKYTPSEDHYEDIRLFVNGAIIRGTAVIRNSGEVRIYADISNLITVTDSSYVGYYNWSTFWIKNT